MVSGGDQLRATVVVPTRPRLFQFYGLSYSTPVNANGTILTGNFSYLRTRPAAFPLKGDAKSYGLQASHPVIRNYRDSLYATVGIDGVDSDNALLGETLSNDRTRALRTGLSYSRTSERNFFSIGVTGSAGLDNRRGKLDRVEPRRNDSLAIALLGGRDKIGDAHRRTAMSRREHRLDLVALGAARAEQKRCIAAATSRFAPKSTD